MIDWSTHMAEEAAGVNDTTNPEWCDQCYADPCDCDHMYELREGK